MEEYKGYPPPNEQPENIFKRTFKLDHYEKKSTFFDPKERMYAELMHLYFKTLEQVEKNENDGIELNCFECCLLTVKNLLYYIYIHTWCCIFNKEVYKQYKLAEKMVELAKNNFSKNKEK